MTTKPPPVQDNLVLRGKTRILPKNSVTLTNNGEVGVDASGFYIRINGSDKTVVTNPSPVLVTPNIGVATGTSLTLTGNGAASTPVVSLTGTWFSGGTSTTTKPILLIEPTSTTSTGWSTLGTGLGINAPVGFTGNLIDAQLAGVSKFKVGYNAKFWLGYGDSVNNPMFRANGSNLQVMLGTEGAGTMSVACANFKAEATGKIGWVAGTDSSAAHDTAFSRVSAATVEVNNGTLVSSGGTIGGIEAGTIYNWNTGRSQNTGFQLTTTGSLWAIVAGAFMAEFRVSGSVGLQLGSAYALNWTTGAVNATAADAKILRGGTGLVQVQADNGLSIKNLAGSAGSTLEAAVLQGTSAGTFWFSSTANLMQLSSSTSFGFTDGGPQVSLSTKLTRPSTGLMRISGDNGVEFADLAGSVSAKINPSINSPFRSYNGATLKGWFGQSYFCGNSATLFAWTSTTDANGTIDTAVGRTSTGIEINNGTPGTYKALTCGAITASGAGTFVNSTTSGTTEPWLNVESQANATGLVAKFKRTGESSLSLIAVGVTDMCLVASSDIALCYGGSTGNRIFRQSGSKIAFMETGSNALTNLPASSVAIGRGFTLCGSTWSTTTEGVVMWDIVGSAIDNTHASRKYRTIINTYDTAAREAIRLDATGSSVRVGIGGAVDSSALLMVNGNAKITVASSSDTPANAPLTIQNSSSTVGTTPGRWCFGVGHSGSYDGYLKIAGPLASGMNDWILAFNDSATAANRIITTPGTISAPLFASTVQGLGDMPMVQWSAAGTNYNGTTYLGMNHPYGNHPVKVVISRASGHASNVAGTKLTIEDGDGTEHLSVSNESQVILGSQVALATNATKGFAYIPTCAGTPTGTPTSVTGKVPIIVDTTNHKLYFYSGGSWRDAGP